MISVAYARYRMRILQAVSGLAVIKPWDQKPLAAQTTVSCSLPSLTS